MRALLQAAALLLGLAGSEAAAQDASDVPRSPILVIESARLFPETLFGQSILAAINEERRAFAAENEAIASAFRREELALTEQRGILAREDFARLAADFDLRVQAARNDRDSQEAALNARSETQERTFLQQIRPILAQIMGEAGAAVLVEADAVLLRADAIDITDLAIARINANTEPARGLPSGPEAAE
ncbi:MAG: OmpH family outer membrane protein [Pseudomonadota bacterium]